MMSGWVSPNVDPPSLRDTQKKWIIAAGTWKEPVGRLVLLSEIRPITGKWLSALEAREQSVSVLSRLDRRAVPIELGGREHRDQSSQEPSKRLSDVTFGRVKPGPSNFRIDQGESSVAL